MAHDRLVFDGGIADKHMAGWTGPWPPPERWGVAVGEQTGYVSIFIDSIAEPLLDDVKSVATVQFYKLVSASKIPSTPDSPNLARAAKYVPDGDPL